ncbi:hypothetical protein K493DRAFT_316564 [Basidiobolus meristosporus CBS 931.73]|uniref:SH3 domain-containing protein n=1 Tax=Basidiobolus meristosporus CBS 931.73 TaxID=1314790 RepID=A0A1Y1Y3B6_9FUNG|nr:hypothetical protein K493DRAFT_316564 [Basidiobolus meristosporus CBS 931.73]|eukprot:ORX92469.1 hypothetical protein K493DRAFT_316564 [Basidiobolus meristosporus CBS 931.73]
MPWCFCANDPKEDSLMQGRGIFVALRNFPSDQEKQKSSFSKNSPLCFSKGDRIQLVENHGKYMVGYVESDPSKTLGWFPSDALEFISQNNPLANPMSAGKLQGHYLNEIVVEPLSLEMFRFDFKAGSGGKEEARCNEAPPCIPAKVLMQ